MNKRSSNGSHTRCNVSIPIRRESDEASYVKRLLTAGARAAMLGIAVLDSQTRFESVNTALSCETRLDADLHIGKTSGEITGELARQIEPTYEHVLRTGKPASVLLTGRVRDTPEFGYWFDHCFPIFDRAGRVQQLGLFVVNITAERATREILEALPNDPILLRADNSGVLEKFDESIRHYHASLRMGLEQLAIPGPEAARKADNVRSFMQELDREIGDMRELIYAFISRFSIPRC